MNNRKLIENLNNLMAQEADIDGLLNELKNSLILSRSAINNVNETYVSNFNWLLFNLISEKEFEENNLENLSPNSYQCSIKISNKQMNKLFEEIDKLARQQVKEFNELIIKLLNDLKKEIKNELQTKIDEFIDLNK